MQLNPITHLKVNDVAIEGSLYEFSAKLENSGLQLMDADFGKGSSMFSGNYEGFEDSYIVANADPDGSITSVTVMVKAKEKGISSIVNDVYAVLKKSLKESYGVPIVELEDFSGMERELRKRIKDGKAATTQFTTAAGVVMLTLGYDPLVGGYFAVVLYDLTSRQN